MSLIIYDKITVPMGVKIIKCNDLFFNGNPIIPNTEQCKNIMRVIDKAEYISKRSFKGRTEEMGNLDSKFLSTGTKTLINIICHTDMCFNVCECGRNALQLLIKMTEGIVYWERPFIAYVENPECDIIYDNRRFTNTGELFTYTVKRWGVYDMYK